jgi:hypothetical protein
MDLRFVEVTNGAFNWGKFAVGRHTKAEWFEPEQMDGAIGHLLTGRGWSYGHFWVLDLQTGEGAMFHPGGSAHADMTRHQLWVCPMFEPFLEWLYAHVRDVPDAWWDTLPRVLDLPDAQPHIYGHRRPGPSDQSRRLIELWGMSPEEARRLIDEIDGPAGD